MLILRTFGTFKINFSNKFFYSTTSNFNTSTDCPLWSLLWPVSSLLCHLKEPWFPTSSSPPSVTGPLCVKTKPQRRVFPQRVRQSPTSNRPTTRCLPVCQYLLRYTFLKRLLMTEALTPFFFLKGSGWRAEISESVRQLLMEEVSTSNPPFPIQMFTTRFLKRRADHHIQQQQSAASGRSDRRVAALGRREAW